MGQITTIIENPKEYHLKTIGLIGGMSWQSTLDYYIVINEFIQKTLGSLYSAKILLSSINFVELESLQKNHEWSLAGELILNEALKLQRAGADYILICSNTGNECVNRIQKKLTIPIIHIADVIGAECNKNGFKTVGLLGTIHTMEQNFIKEILANKYKLSVLIPDKADRILVNNVIYKELCIGKLYPSSKTSFIKIIKKLHHKGADAVILGCTEIPILIKQSDVAIPIINSTALHAEYAAKMSVN